MKFSMKMLFLISFLSVTFAFPSVGTSTGFMRQRIMLRRIVHRRKHFKLAKQAKVVSIGNLAASIQNMKKNQNAVRQKNAMLKKINNY